MKQILNKWYLSLIIIPILLTYLTNYFTLPTLFSDWKITFIFSLSILSVILIIELIISYQKFKEISLLPKAHDVKRINKLLKTLDIKSFERDICKTNVWDGYNQKSMHKVIAYQHKTNLIAYKTTDVALNKLLNNLNSKLEEFIDFTCCHVYGNSANFLIPYKYNNREKAKTDSIKINQLALLAFKELEVLLNYLKENKYR